MLKVLQQPYPHNDSTRRKLFLSFAAGIFISAFLLFFQPFDIANWHDDAKVYILMGFGIITSDTMLFIYFGVQSLFPNYFKEEQWTVGREIGMVALNVLSIMTINVLYTQYYISNGFNMLNLVSMVIYTLVLGVFPATGIILINYIFYLKQYSKPPQPSHLPEKHLEEVSTNNEIILIAENGKDSIMLKPDSFFYIESSDNYSTVVFLNENVFQKELIRSSLTRLENQISQTQIVRCHRSFIVNLNKVDKVTGNAQGYKLHLNESDFVIPVARRYSEIVYELK
ncbi:LytTR family DNA-binding domain-containing protein [Arcicella rosea]|uniref:HTH LytTR-type domain-containing protein n=1 Tax=Arcicella rosea TaxID=502909 RepID=A0A841EWL7_9BACT|nr:LytTR family DNA-binding domain-containing protein [Arcicella rosea]MBB6004710.1 hypothetical protein [Arcicella rosea]